MEQDNPISLTAEDGLRLQIQLAEESRRKARDNPEIRELVDAKDEESVVEAVRRVVDERDGIRTAWNQTRRREEEITNEINDFVNLLGETWEAMIALDVSKIDPDVRRLMDVLGQGWTKLSGALLKQRHGNGDRP